MKLLVTLSAIALTVLANELPASLKEFYSGNLEFTAKTYKELAKSNSENFLVSPLSVEVVLALVEAGARGETARQLKSGLNLPSTDEAIREAFKSISPSLNINELYTLTSANNIYIKNGFKINPQFKEVSHSVFNAGFEQVDFTSSQTPGQINKWINEKTHGKIDNVVSSDDFDEDTRAVIVNALYFQGLWLNRFYDGTTQDKTFFVNTKEEVKVKMMEQTDFFNYYKDENLKATFLQMPYYGSPITITFVLPDEIDGLPQLEKDIDKVLATPKLSFENVHVQIPRIKIEAKIDFIPILQEFGITDVFNKNSNLTGIAESDEKLLISKVVQKTFIEVNEKGTTAAAATVAIAIAESAFISDTPLREFHANHPFIFILKSPNGILFAGRFVNPA